NPSLSSHSRPSKSSPAARWGKNPWKNSGRNSFRRFLKRWSCSAMTPPRAEPRARSGHAAPRGTGFRSLLLQQQPLQERLLRVHAVARLLEREAAFAGEYLAGHLLAAVRRQAVHHPRVLWRQRQQVGVDLVAGEALQPQLALALLAHARPDVRVDDVGLIDSVSRVAVLHQLAG